MTIAKTMKKASTRVEKMLDDAGNGKFKEQVAKVLKDGKEKLSLFEQRVKSGDKLKGFQDKMRLSEKKISAAKLKFERFGKRAEQYVEKNPKKALALAAAAGVVAGTLWAAFNKKKPVTKKRKAAR